MQGFSKCCVKCKKGKSPFKLKLLTTVTNKINGPVFLFIFYFEGSWQKGWELLRDKCFHFSYFDVFTNS